MVLLLYAATALLVLGLAATAQAAQYSPFTLIACLAFTAAFSLAILAALGVDELLRRRDDRAAALTLKRPC